MGFINQLITRGAPPCRYETRLKKHGSPLSPCPGDMTFVGSSLAVDVCGAAEDEDAPGRNGLHQLQGAVPARHAPAEIHVRPVLRWWMNRWDLEHRHDLKYHGNGEYYVQWEYMPYFSALYMVGTSNLGSWNGH